MFFFQVFTIHSRLIGLLLKREKNHFTGLRSTVKLLVIAVIVMLDKSVKRKMNICLVDYDVRLRRFRAFM